MITIQQTLADLKAVSRDFNKIAEQTDFAKYGDMSYLEADYENADQVFYVREINSIIEKIDDMVHRITYLSRPIAQTTTIHLNSDGRYETASECPLMRASSIMKKGLTLSHQTLSYRDWKLHWSIQ